MAGRWALCAVTVLLSLSSIRGNMKGGGQLHESSNSWSGLVLLPYLVFVVRSWFGSERPDVVVSLPLSLCKDHVVAEVN